MSDDWDGTARVVEEQSQCPPARAQVLDEAKRLITGDRNRSYGSPTQNFQDTAVVWSTIFRHKLAPGEVFTPADIAAAMVALKLMRRIAGDKADNWVDICGYAACGYECDVETNAVEGGF